MPATWKAPVDCRSGPAQQLSLLDRCLTGPQNNMGPGSTQIRAAIVQKTPITIYLTTLTWNQLPGGSALRAGACCARRNLAQQNLIHSSKQLSAWTGSTSDVTKALCWTAGITTAYSDSVTQLSSRQLARESREPPTSATELVVGSLLHRNSSAGPCAVVSRDTAKLAR